MLTQEKKLLLIGQVTDISGIPIRTIRYYESLGLIKSSRRTEGGFRQFSLDVLTRLAFIKRAQNLGLSLEEIGNILQSPLPQEQSELPFRCCWRKRRNSYLEV